MKRNSFQRLVELLRTSTVFTKKHKYKNPRPLYQQLLVFLYRVGCFGSSDSCHEVALFFGIGIGTVKNYVDNIIMALKEIESEVVYWHNEDDREQMKT